MEARQAGAWYIVKFTVSGAHGLFVTWPYTATAASGRTLEMIVLRGWSLRHLTVDTFPRWSVTTMAAYIEMQRDDVCGLTWCDGRRHTSNKPMYCIQLTIWPHSVYMTWSGRCYPSCSLTTVQSTAVCHVMVIPWLLINLAIRWMSVICWTTHVVVMLWCSCWSVQYTLTGLNYWDMRHSVSLCNNITGLHCLFLLLDVAAVLHRAVGVVIFLL